MQGGQDSNLQPAVLETAALPIEPPPFVGKQLSSDFSGEWHTSRLKSKDDYIKKSFFGEIIPFETFKKLVSNEYEPTDKHIEKNISDYLEALVKENQDQFAACNLGLHDQALAGF